MRLESLFTEIQTTFDMLYTLKVNKAAFDERLQYWNGIAANQKLQRETYALREFITWQYQLYMRKLSLAYVFGGKYYSTSKEAIPGTLSTEVLHTLPEHIPMKGWDAMGQFSLYSTGEVFSRNKEEDTEVSKQYFSLVQG